MDTVIIKFETDSKIRASETIADLRNAAETLYFPMRVAGFWDYQLDIHLCPQEERRQECPHKLSESDPNFVSYIDTLQRERHTNLEVVFPHANVRLYLT